MSLLLLFRGGAGSGGGGGGGGGGGAGGGAAAGVDASNPIRYARIRAVDWNGNIGNFSSIINLQNGLATSNHIGFQAATQIVRAEFGPGTFLCYATENGATGIMDNLQLSTIGPNYFNTNGLHNRAIYFGHTDIVTLGGTLLIDIAMVVVWDTQAANTQLVVTLWVDDQILDQSGILVFPCDLFAAGLVDARNVLTGMGLPAQLAPGLHTVWAQVEIVGALDLSVAIDDYRVALLELRR